MTTPHRTLQMALDALENSYLSDEHRNYELQAKAITALREALAAPPAAPAPAAPVPDGWVMVPREPTPEMLAVVRNGPMCETWAAGYRAMIAASPAAPVVPIDMVLHCPKCGLQHIDAPDERTHGWRNEPHRSHLCHGCGHIWRPADVPTNGVAAVATKGKADSPIAAPVVREPLTDEQIWSMWMSSEFRGNGGQADWFCEGIRAAEAHHGITGGKP